MLIVVVIVEPDHASQDHYTAGFQPPPPVQQRRLQQQQQDAAQLMAERQRAFAEARAAAHRNAQHVAELEEMEQRQSTLPADSFARQPSQAQPPPLGSPVDAGLP